MTDVYFISDLHLSESNNALLEAFNDFIDMMSAQSNGTLYILGDLFDYYLGKDIDSDFHQLIAGQLHRLCNNNMTVYVMPGNRDFLIDDAFIRASGATLLAEPTVISLANQRMVLMHGDLLCIDDKSHLWFRKIASFKLIQKLFLSTPIQWRINIAKKIRNIGRRKHITIDMEQVKSRALVKQLKYFNAQGMIHGHTHQPMVRWFENGPNRYRHVILPDWHKKMVYLKWRHQQQVFQFKHE